EMGGKRLLQRMVFRIVVFPGVRGSFGDGPEHRWGGAEAVFVGADPCFHGQPAMSFNGLRSDERHGGRKGINERRETGKGGHDGGPAWKIRHTIGPISGGASPRRAQFVPSAERSWSRFKRAWKSGPAALSRNDGR